MKVISESKVIEDRIDSSSTDFGAAFTQSLGYNAVQRPYDGLSQLANHASGTTLLPKMALVDAPAQPTTTLANIGQYAGSIVGSALPYVLLTHSVGAGAAKELAQLSTKELTAAASAPALLKAATSGAVFGLVLDPVADENHFWQGKLAAAASTAASMTALTAFQIKLKGTDASLLRNDAVSGALAGFPSGIVAANVSSVIRDGKFASASDDLNAGVGGAFTGGIIGGASQAYNHFNPINGIKNVHSLADLKRVNNDSIKVSGEPAPYYHVISEVDSPVSIKETLAGKINYLPPASRDIIASAAADLTASHEVAKTLGPSVAFFASARKGEDTFSYQRARWLSNRLAQQGFAIIDGGGPGGMEGASRGAFEAGGTAVGIRAELPFWEPPNKYVDIATVHKDISSRIEALAKIPDAFIIEMGGLGTDLEALMVLQLMQLKHLEKKPFYFVDVEHGQDLDRMLGRQAERGLLKDEDRGLYKVTGNVQQILDELTAYKKVLDVKHNDRQQESTTYSAPALPRRHTVARVTESPKEGLTFSEFLAMTPEEMANLDVKASPHQH
jgi:uncharacterized protein (TIGR00730 family)